MVARLLPLMDADPVVSCKQGTWHFQPVRGSAMVFNVGRGLWSGVLRMIPLTFFKQDTLIQNNTRYFRINYTWLVAGCQVK
jgi:hypothetical protein